MKKQHMTLIILLLLPFSLVNAQKCDSEKDQMEKIKARKVAFFTAKMELTVAESQVFWHLYIEYSEKKEQLLAELFPKLSDEELNKLMNLSDKEASERMDAYFAKQERLNILEKEYNRKFKKILPPYKVMRMYLSEMMFRRELLENLRGSKRKK